MPSARSATLDECSIKTAPTCRRATSVRYTNGAPARTRRFTNTGRRTTTCRNTSSRYTAANDAERNRQAAPLRARFETDREIERNASLKRELETVPGAIEPPGAAAALECRGRGRGRVGHRAAHLLLDRQSPLPPAAGEAREPGPLDRPAESAPHRGAGARRRCEPPGERENR